MQDYPIVIGEEALKQIPKWIKTHEPSQVMVFADTHTYSDCYPLLSGYLPTHHVTVIPPGEIHKNLSTCEILWQALTDHQFDRKGLVINLGGGVLGDMGGFVAATYKRGMDFIQIPTTLLAQVDASVGGKLGIDFQTLKNHIGIFQFPQAVLIYPPFLKTLPTPELVSGFAEVVKHHLIADRDAWRKLVQVTDIHALDFPAIIQHSVEIKSKIVELDYKESGARKALNFGHTLGHAIESLFLEEADLTTLLHGEAIAIGMIGESQIAHQMGKLPKDELEDISHYILTHFSKVDIPKGYLDAVYTRMLQDKKNAHGSILCTLVPQIGEYEINIPLQKSHIAEALKFYRELNV
ncbi:MAG: 3-dehydroquinate synthase [Bacteroidota bacterium]